jgi:hypothetical protein
LRGSTTFGINDEEVAFDDKTPINYLDEIVSAGSSFRSGTTSKYEVDPFERENDDIKSRFVSSSSEEETDSNEESDEEAEMKQKLNYLKQNSDAFKKDATAPKLLRQGTAVIAKNKKTGDFEMSGWVLKRATTTYMGMANW